jgi:hypothetical protein
MTETRGVILKQTEQQWFRIESRRNDDAPIASPVAIDLKAER